jgi:hypothetical protein
MNISKKTEPTIASIEKIIGRVELMQWRPQ